MGDNAQKRTLTRAERAVLEVLCDPKYHKATQQEKYEAAGISKRRFYEIMADEWFREQQRLYMLQFIQGQIAPLVDAAVESGTVPTGHGHPDRKMLFEMAGLYVPPKQRTEHSGSLTLTGGLSGLLAEAEEADDA